MILSLQGCMAVGKTTALRYLQEHAPYLHVNWEERGKVIREVGRRGLRKDVYEDYVEIQRLWLRNEATRHKKALAPQHRHGLWCRGDRVLHAELPGKHRRQLGSREAPGRGARCRSSECLPARVWCGWQNAHEMRWIQGLWHPSDGSGGTTCKAGASPRCQKGEKDASFRRKSCDWWHKTMTSGRRLLQVVASLPHGLRWKSDNFARREVTATLPSPGGDLLCKSRPRRHTTQPCSVGACQTAQKRKRPGTRHGSSSRGVSRGVAARVHHAGACVGGLRPGLAGNWRRLTFHQST